ncbi:hypothetical protein STEG23_036212 [Scotinomys teguina]
MTVTPLGRDQDCSLKIREPDVPAPWFLDPGGWSKAAAVRLYFIFPGICTLSLLDLWVGQRSFSHTDGKSGECNGKSMMVQGLAGIWLVGGEVLPTISQILAIRTKLTSNSPYHRMKMCLRGKPGQIIAGAAVY